MFSYNVPCSSRLRISAFLVLFLSSLAFFFPFSRARDSYERICLCFQIITQGNKAANEVLLHLSRQSYALYLQQLAGEGEKNKPAVQVVASTFFFPNS